MSEIIETNYYKKINNIKNKEYYKVYFYKGSIYSKERLFIQKKDLDKIIDSDCIFVNTKTIKPYNKNNLYVYCKNNYMKLIINFNEDDKVKDIITKIYDKTLLVPECQTLWYNDKILQKYEIPNFKNNDIIYLEIDETKIPTHETTELVIL